MITQSKRWLLTAPCTILIIVMVFRASLLGYSDLIDPTETRYACIAQQMVLDQDWVTPKLPQPEGVVAYLGKPPLHFWMTALIYEFTGFSNWGSRFPSFIATIIIILAVIIFARHFFGKESALLAALISVSCAVPFFLAGASVIDVTLSAAITAS